MSSEMARSFFSIGRLLAAFLASGSKAGSFPFPMDDARDKILRKKNSGKISGKRLSQIADGAFRVRSSKVIDAIATVSRPFASRAISPTREMPDAQWGICLVTFSPRETSIRRRIAEGSGGGQRRDLGTLGPHRGRPRANAWRIRGTWIDDRKTAGEDGDEVEPIAFFFSRARARVSPDTRISVSRVSRV